MEINELIEQAKKRANISSDYALAKVLGIDRRVISDWKKDKRHPNNEEAIKLATLAGVDEMQVIASIELMTANTDKKKEFWKHYIESRGIAATVVMIGLGVSLMVAPDESKAEVLQLQNYSETAALNFYESRIYIMRNSLNYKALLIKAIFYKIRQTFSRIKNDTPSLRPKAV